MSSAGGEKLRVMGQDDDSNQMVGNSRAPVPHQKVNVVCHAAEKLSGDVLEQDGRHQDVGRVDQRTSKGC